jgi:hypothetical protein
MNDIQLRGLAVAGSDAAGRKSPHNHAQTARNLRRTLRNAAAGARLIRPDGLDSKSAADVAASLAETRLFYRSWRPARLGVPDLPYACPACKACWSPASWVRSEDCSLNLLNSEGSSRDMAIFRGHAVAAHGSFESTASCAVGNHRASTCWLLGSASWSERPLRLDCHWLVLSIHWLPLLRVSAPIAS